MCSVQCCEANVIQRFAEFGSTRDEGIGEMFQVRFKVQFGCGNLGGLLLENRLRRLAVSFVALQEKYVGQYPDTKLNELLSVRLPVRSSTYFGRHKSWIRLADAISN
jgi:hypothetical protein